MLEGGVLRLSASRVERTRQGCTEPEAFAALSVSDDGIGMDEQTQARLFEPFFSTKDATKGTGLGMAVVAAAVEQHNALIDVHSALGKGTNIAVFFPLVVPGAEEQLEREGFPIHDVSGTERILVVDDDERVIRSIRRSLERHGYEVVVANDGRQALELLSTVTVDLVIANVNMPNLCGLALFDRVRKEYSDLPFLFAAPFRAAVPLNKRSLTHPTHSWLSHSRNGIC